MAEKRLKKAPKTTRREALIAGLGVFGTARAAEARSPAAQGSGDTARAWTPKKEAVRRPGQAAQSGALLSSCIRSGHLLFVAGIGGWYPERRKEAGDIKVQMQSALTTMKETLESAGSSMANVLKVHMTVADANKNIALLNEGYRGFFPDPPPVRSYTGVPAGGMGRDGVLVQVDCIAYVD